MSEVENHQGASSMKRTSRSLALLSAAAMVGSLALISPAQAAPARADGETLASKLLSPLSLAVAKSGTVYVTDNFTGGLWQIPQGGKASPVYQSTEKNAEVGGASTYAKKVTFTVTGKKKTVMQWKPGGKPTLLANVGAWEEKKNPDKAQTYGVQGASAECAAKWPEKETGVPVTYTGIVDSHPYSTYTTADGVYVGEAAGNDILWIANSGKIKTLAVLPPTEVTITADAVAELHLDPCFTNLKYWLEPVPTDVELGPDGWLYVSSLPGGPESAALGANGRVYKVNPKSGKVKLVAAGFIGTVDLAVARNGDLYVAQLFAGGIAKVKAGSSKVKPFLDVPAPGAVEWTKGALYYTQNALPGKSPKGKVIRLPW
jgi:hypothetical protein